MGIGNMNVVHMPAGLASGRKSSWGNLGSMEHGIISNENGGGSMKLNGVLKIPMLAVMIFSAAALVCAEDMTVTIKQPFIAGGKNYPAGHYRILADSGSDQIDLLNLDRKTDDAIKCITRLSQREGHWGEIVFDKDENNLYLSEVYLVGIDGFFFQGAPGKHKHVVYHEDVPK
jgi:hypothetical protein